jgi:hypothetical protein
MSSGSEVVGAATMPPVGAYVRAFSVIRERITASRYGPWYVQCSTHSRQKSSVACSEASGSGSAGGCLCEGSQEIVNAIRSPGATVKSEYVVSDLP